MKKIILTSSAADVGYDLGRVLSKKPQQSKLLFVTTASEGETGDKNWVKQDRAGLEKAGFNISDYTISNQTMDQVKEKIMSTNVLFINGGNNFYLLEKMNQVGFSTLLSDFFEKGGVYAGSSAGSIVAGPDIEPSRLLENDLSNSKLKSTKGLGLVDFIVLPHWGSDSFKDRYLNQRLDHAYGISHHPIVLLKDLQYMVVEDEKVKIVNLEKG